MNKTAHKGVVSGPPVVLAVASAGGHWQQMMQIIDAFDATQLVVASTNPELGHAYGFYQVRQLPDCNQDNPVKVLVCLWHTFRLVRSLRPDLVVSTGAAPGLLCLIWGRLSGAKTIWIDSIANSEKLSLSGRLATWFAGSVLTQWSHLANGERPGFKGAVL